MSQARTWSCRAHRACMTTHREPLAADEKSAHLRHRRSRALLARSRRSMSCRPAASNVSGHSDSAMFQGTFPKGSRLIGCLPLDSSCLAGRRPARGFPSCWWESQRRRRWRESEQRRCGRECCRQRQWWECDRRRWGRQGARCRGRCSGAHSRCVRASGRRRTLLGQRRLC